MATELDERVEEFEQARAAGRSADLREYLPSRESDSYRQTALELMRVDLEYGWRSGSPRSIEEYLTALGDVLADPASLAALAFEEHRLRLAAGQASSPAEYARRFSIDTSGWPADVNGTATTADFPRAGARWLGFQLLRELGRGAFGRVYLAEQEDLAHRRVAIKVTTHVTAEPERLAQLQHANIVPIYSLHRHGDLQVLCMPYYGDQTLADWLRSWTGRSIAAINDTGEARRDETIPVVNAPKTETPARDLPSHQAPVVGTAGGGERAEQALRIMLGIASGLAHAHRRGIVHRDLKPANVLLRDDGAPLLLDFNLASNVAESDSRRAGAGGTLPYMAPEQLASLETGEAVDARADIFACGVLCFEMLTGARPFADGATHDPAPWRAMREERLRGLSGAAPLARAASADVTSIVLKCLAPRPADRYASAAELEEDLRRHLEHLPLRHAANRSWRERAKKWLLRHPKLGSGTTVAAVSSLALLAAFLAIQFRGRQIARLDAVSSREAYLRAAPEIRAALTTADLEPALAGEAIEAADRLLTPYVQGNDEAWRNGDRVTLLDAAQRDELLADIDEMSRALRDAAERIPASTSDSDATRHWRNSTAATTAPRTGRGDELSRARSATCEQIRRGDFAEAALSAERWVELAPRDFEARFQLANAFKGCGRLDDAERAISVCAALSRNSVVAFYQRGAYRNELQMWTGARDDFTRVLTLRPNMAGALVNRAIARMGLGDRDGAMNDLTAAIATHRVPARAYFLRSQLYSRLGRSAEARADRERGLALTPIDAPDWVARGVARLAESPQAALADFQSALEIDPANRAALQSSAHVLSERLGRTEEAIASLTRLLELYPKEADARAGRAVLLARLGKAEESLADAATLISESTAPLHVYQAACAYALLSNDSAERRAEALRLLAEAGRRDAALADMARRDADLAALREEGAFQNLMDALRVLHDAGQQARPFNGGR